MNQITSSFPVSGNNNHSLHLGLIHRFYTLQYSLFLFL